MIGRHDKIKPLTKPASHRVVKVMRGSVLAVVLWLIWVEWRPVYFTLAEDLVPVENAVELASLAPGSAFLLHGTVEPATATDRHWQERFTFVHRARKDFAGGPSKDQRVVDIENWRPALRLRWLGGNLLLPADGYSLAYAPRVEPRFWPRKWMGMKRLDDWHLSSTGFRRGEAALAYGHVTEGGRVQVEELMQWPLQKVVSRIGHENRLRSWLTLGGKVVLSLFCLLYFGRGRHRSLKAERKRG